MKVFNEEVLAVIGYYTKLGYTITIPPMEYWRGRASTLTVRYKRAKNRSILISDSEPICHKIIQLAQEVYSLYHDGELPKDI